MTLESAGFTKQKIDFVERGEFCFHRFIISQQLFLRNFNVYENLFTHIRIRITPFGLHTGCTKKSHTCHTYCSILVLDTPNSVRRRLVAPPPGPTKQLTDVDRVYRIVQCVVFVVLFCRRQWPADPTKTTTTMLFFYQNRSRTTAGILYSVLLLYCFDYFTAVLSYLFRREGRSGGDSFVSDFSAASGNLFGDPTKRVQSDTIGLRKTETDGQLLFKLRNS